MSAATFHLFMWPHRLLFIGPAFDTEPHRHHAAQLAVGLGGGLRMRGADRGPWLEAPAFYVPPDVPHALDAGETRCALLYLDPEGSECEHARGRFGATAISPLDDDLPIAALRALAAGDGEGAEAAAACEGLLGLAPSTAHRTLEPRLRRALDWIDEHWEEGIRLASVAAAIGVSESWLSHRFSGEIGVPLRRYVLWRRLRLALEAALQGATLTEAAHAAGFADSAHLTRTFREAFGVAPAFLFGARDRLRVEFID